MGRRAGSAVVWQALQLGGVKSIFLVRLLILAHLLLPSDFGLLAMAAIALDFLLDLTNLGLQPALIQRDRLSERHYHAAWTVGVLRAAGIALIVVLAAPAVAELFAEPRATNVIRWIGLRPLLQALASPRIVDLARELRFKALAFLRLTEAIVASVVAIALASRFGVWALVFGVLSGPVVFALLSYVVVPHRPRVVVEREAFGTLMSFGKWVLVAGVAAMLGRTFLQATISRRLGAADLGLYFLASKLAFLPADVAGEVFGNVAFPMFSRIKANRAKTANAFRGLLLGIAALLVPPLALIFLLAPSLVAALGSQWDGAAPVIRLLAAASFVGLLSEAAVPLFKGSGRPDLVAWLEVTQYGVIAGSVWFLAGRFGLEGAAGSWLPGVLLAQALCAVSLYRVVDGPFAGLGRGLASIAAVSAGGAAIAWSVRLSLPGTVGLVVAGGTGATFVALGLWLLERRLDLGITGVLRNTYPRLVGLLGLDGPGSRGPLGGAGGPVSVSTDS
jgi:PST family polysaccharide transporter/lipopolysaccharide exporter